MMNTPILVTKLYIPPPRTKIVLRPRLSDQLNEGLSVSRKLTLISAPAGFGKSTLISEWAAVCNRPVAWLSLSEGENDPALFLTYLIAALQTIMPKVGAGVLGLIQSPQSPSSELILTALLNEIAAITDPFILILDDYHLIEAKSVDQVLSFLLEHLPPKMHLVIATREDPHLPLARLRVRSQLTELRAADLRFTPAEATEFFNRIMGLNLSAEDIIALEARTEGWIAGLQLATLSMQGNHDKAGFIKSFTGSHRFILDYLVEEVLQRQPEHVRNFLLQTAILDRLSSPLCDAVTGQEDGRGMLEVLERGNLFVIPLDDQRQWYRYHHLFAEVLRAHLHEAQPDHVSPLHRRASEWYMQNGLTSDAIRHALASGDFEWAAGLIELAWSSTEDGNLATKHLGWAKALPDELVRNRPVLCVWYAYALLGIGEMEAAEARLTDAERWLEPAGSMNGRPKNPTDESFPERSRRMVIADEEQFRSLPAAIAIARAYHAQALGDVPGTITHAQRALALMQEANHLGRGQANGLLGIAYWASGDLEAATLAFTGYTTMLRMAGNILDAISATVVLAEIRLALGRLREAIRTIEPLLEFVMDQGESILFDAADLHRGLSELYLEQGNLEVAAQHLQESTKLGENAELPVWRSQWCVAQARLKTTQGDLDAALVFLDKAERLFVRSPLPDVRPISALKARIWIMQGRLAEAQGWAREQGLSIDDATSYLLEFKHVTLARMLIAQYEIDREDRSIHEAIGLLERLLHAAEAGGRMRSVIEILVLQALAHQAQGNIAFALASLGPALNLAESEGYVRIFADEGKPMAELLTRMDAKDGTFHSTDYRIKLLSAFDMYMELRPFRSTPVGNNKTSLTARQVVNSNTLIEPLSEREMDVLKLLGTDLSGPEIAGQLFVSLNTFHTHTKSIYNKLGVNHRRAAVRRAEELDLF
jgi:LuxR family maltose regulon positive regulatory protein